MTLARCGLPSPRCAPTQTKPSLEEFKDACFVWLQAFSTDCMNKSRVDLCQPCHCHVGSDTLCSYHIVQFADSLLDLQASKHSIEQHTIRIAVRGLQALHLNTARTPPCTHTCTHRYGWR